MLQSSGVSRLKTWSREERGRRGAFHPETYIQTDVQEGRERGRKGSREKAGQEEAGWSKRKRTEEEGGEEGKRLEKVSFDKLSEIVAFKANYVL